MDFNEKYYNEQIDFLKKEKEKCDALNQRELFSIAIKRLELERDKKLTSEIKSFFCMSRKPYQESFRL